MRILAVVMILVLGLFGARAQDETATDAAPWQAVITGQIEAFRAGDGEGALELAGASFKEQFTDPDLFYEVILGSGYEPIVRSRSHSFADFDRFGGNGVVQEVRLVGPELDLFVAIYQMAEEEDGWRVQGVVLRQDQGMSI